MLTRKKNSRFLNHLLLLLLLFSIIVVVDTIQNLFVSTSFFEQGNVSVVSIKVKPRFTSLARASFKSHFGNITVKRLR